MTGTNTIRLILFLLIACFPISGQSRDLGTSGATYSIAERDALEEIEERARQVDWGKLFDREKSEQKIKSYKPKDLALLPRADRDSVRSVDISYRLEFDIPDGQGGILYPRGFSFNPLDYIVYPRTIVVINGTDREQVEWFKGSSYAGKLTTVLWITDGSYFDLSVELGRAVFYANAMIVNRFDLRAVPCVIAQKGNLLEVFEIDVKARTKKRSS
jgi:conjugal transfer pilus assembly protein TraW